MGFYFFDLFVERFLRNLVFVSQVAAAESPWALNRVGTTLLPVAGFVARRANVRPFLGEQRNEVVVHTMIVELAKLKKPDTVISDGRTPWEKGKNRWTNPLCKFLPLNRGGPVAHKRIWHRSHGIQYNT